MEQKSKFDKVMGAWDILVIAFGADLPTQSLHQQCRSVVVNMYSVTGQWDLQVLLCVHG